MGTAAVYMYIEYGNCCSIHTYIKYGNCSIHTYIISGLKPGQRKVLFTCFKRNDKREIKVAQLAGSVAEHSAYHHGEVYIYL